MVLKGCYLRQCPLRGVCTSVLVVLLLVGGGRLASEPAFREETLEEEGAAGAFARSAPVIGVLMQPVDWEAFPEGREGGTAWKEGLSYIAASYIQFIEASGSVALPIDSDLSEEEHRRLFKQINGLLLPGGSADISSWESPYLRLTRLYYGLAVKANKAGSFFPIFGVCLGFEALLIAASKNLSYFQQQHDGDMDSRRRLQFSPEAPASVLFGVGSLPGVWNAYGSPSPSGLLGSPEGENVSHLPGEGSLGGEREAEKKEQVPAPSGGRDLENLRRVFHIKTVTSILETHALAYMNHRRYLTSGEFLGDSALGQEWRLLATTRLPQDGNVEIVAAVEHKRFPFYGVQFHPEKVLFEHCPLTRIPHSVLSQLPSLYLVAFFGTMARQSESVFHDPAEKFSRVAFAFSSRRTARLGAPYHFERVYLFPQVARREQQSKRETRGDWTRAARTPYRPSPPGIVSGEERARAVAG